MSGGSADAVGAGGRVVVGVSGSEASTAALAVALEIARTRGWTVDVVTAWPDLGAPLVHEAPGHYNDARGRAVEGLNRALARCGVELDGPLARVWVENADPVQALVARSRGAQLLVVGAPDRGVSQRSGLPAVGDLCRRLVDCPTLVVDPDHHLLPSA